MKRNLLLGGVLLLALQLFNSCNNNQGSDKTESTDIKNATDSSNKEATVYTFYKVPPEIDSMMKGGKEISSEELEKYKVEGTTLGTSNTSVDCVVQGHSTITCKAPDGKVTTKTGNCDVYYANEGGKWVYCYTRCESCVNVCNR